MDEFNIMRENESKVNLNFIGILLLPTFVSDCKYPVLYELKIEVIFDFS